MKKLIKLVVSSVVLLVGLTMLICFGVNRSNVTAYKYAYTAGKKTTVDILIGTEIKSENRYDNQKREIYSKTITLEQILLYVQSVQDLPISIGLTTFGLLGLVISLNKED
ncbi:MAG: hypothetical protein LBM99_01040 [Bacillales bacterium]|jgi:hypothetical protein|nr:hypothetical protein [Bacillales bacterium]